MEFFVIFPKDYDDVRLFDCGGGAAGFFTAINIVQRNPKAKVAIFRTWRRKS